MWVGGRSFNRGCVFTVNCILFRAMHVANSQILFQNHRCSSQRDTSFAQCHHESACFCQHLKRAHPFHSTTHFGLTPALFLPLRRCWEHQQRRQAVVEHEQQQRQGGGCHRSQQRVAGSSSSLQRQARGQHLHRVRPEEWSLLGCQPRHPCHSGAACFMKPFVG